MCRTARHLIPAWLRCPQMACTAHGIQICAPQYIIADDCVVLLPIHPTNNVLTVLPFPPVHGFC